MSESRSLPKRSNTGPWKTSLGRSPVEGPEEEIPHTEEPFANRGPGTFAERFAVGGTVIARSIKGAVK